MANVIVLIALIGVTRGFFVSDASGSWIFCVERAIELILFTAYLFANLLLDGTFPCAFKMCQGERLWPRGPACVVCGLASRPLHLRETPGAVFAIPRPLSGTLWPPPIKRGAAPPT